MCVLFFGGWKYSNKPKRGPSRDNLGTTALAWGWTEGEPSIKHDQPVRFVSTEHEEDTRGGYWVEKTQTATVRSTTLETNDLRWTYILDASPPLHQFFFIKNTKQIFQIWFPHNVIVSDFTARSCLGFLLLHFVLEHILHTSREAQNLVKLHRICGIIPVTSESRKKNTSVRWVRPVQSITISVSFLCSHVQFSYSMKYNFTKYISGTYYEQVSVHFFGGGPCLVPKPYVWHPWSNRMYIES